MAIQTRIYSDDGQCFGSYNWDDVRLKIVSVHVINRQNIPLTIQECDAATNAVLDSWTLPVGADVTQNIPSGQQQSVVLDARGRISNVYFRTV